MSKSSSSLRKRLAMYTSAAGASVVAGGAMAEVIDANISESVTAVNGSDSIMIDVNGDGTDNFRFTVRDNPYGGYGGEGCGGLDFTGQSDGTGVAHDDSQDGGDYAALISEGSTVDDNSDFRRWNVFLWANCYPQWSDDGLFSPGTRGFIGFQFEADDNTHYGYADVEVQSGSHTGIIHGMFYESTPDTPIIIPTGEPRPAPLAVPVGGAIPLGLLLFAAGAAALRRRNRQLAG